MGNFLHQIRKNAKQTRQSIKLSDLFATVQQRKGDRYVKLFMFSFVVSMLINFYAHSLQYQIEHEYMDYRKNISKELN